MPTAPRADEAGGLYHALNHGNLRADILRKEADFAAFEQIRHEGLEIHQIELHSYQLMSDHYHLVFRPFIDGEMGRFMGWTGGTHTMRYHAHYHTCGLVMFINSDTRAFQFRTKPMESITWAAYIEPPPFDNCPPEQMAKYLARYLTGGPISDRRIVSHENGCVTFLARVGRKTGGDDEVEPIRLRGAEFVRSWCLHILPKGYTKTRRFGGYSNKHRKRYLAECRELLAADSLQPSVSNVAPQVSDVSGLTPPDCEADTTPCCPKCQGKMRRVSFEEKQSWRIIMHSPHRPQWYQDD